MLKIPILKNIKNKIKKIYKILSEKSILDILKIIYEFDVLKIKFRLAFPKKFGILQHNPFVSILIVSFNSAEDLNELLPSLEMQTYNNFEVILVENGSENNSYVVGKYKLNIKYLQSEFNQGFAAGNNLALENAKGEFIALLNPDTRVDENWLLEMVINLKKNYKVSAVAPKIYFYKRFTDVIFESDEDFSLDMHQLDINLNYKKYFILFGNKFSNNKLQSINRKVSIRLPIDESHFYLSIEINNNTFISIKKQDQTRKVFFRKLNINCIDAELNLTTTYNPSSQWLINNAGSSTHSIGPYDRGFAQYDDNQFDKLEFIKVLCGCSFLIRRVAILERSIFQSIFFAYYEDSELSFWLLRKGYKILYCPKSIVYHKHSVSSNEGSIVWETLVNRSKILYDIYTKEADILRYLRLKFSNYNYSNQIPEKLKKILIELDNKASSKTTVFEKNSKKNIAIYNTFWNSKGGGELHALNFATNLQQYHHVFLISETNFDVKELENFFKIDLRNCIKLVCPKINKEITSKFDIFINSSYSSNLIPLSSKSYYIVSFPHKEYDYRILKKYKFIYNSKYTRMWGDIFWSNCKSELILPILDKEIDVDTQFLEKENIVLSVGRITESGHKKNHDKIIETFIKILSDEKRFESWKLVIAGSLDSSRKSDLEYFLKLKSLSKNFPIEIIDNISNERLIALYSKSSIYIHATGLGINYEQEPEKMEHFGIANFEAIYYGCYPLVYYIGGPAELIKDLNVGDTFNSIESLKSKLYHIMNNIKIFDHNKIREKTLLDIKKIVDENNSTFQRLLEEINI